MRHRLKDRIGLSRLDIEQRNNDLNFYIAKLGVLLQELVSGLTLQHGLNPTVRQPGNGLSK